MLPARVLHVFYECIVPGVYTVRTAAATHDMHLVPGMMFRYLECDENVSLSIHLTRACSTADVTLAHKSPLLVSIYCMFILALYFEVYCCSYTWYLALYYSVFQTRPCVISYLRCNIGVDEWTNGSQRFMYTCVLPLNFP